MLHSESVDKTLVKTLATNLASLRRTKGLTQAQLGSAAGITRNHYQLLESGKASSGATANPRLATLALLAQALDVDVPTLLTPSAS